MNPSLASDPYYDNLPADPLEANRLIHLMARFVAKHPEAEAIAPLLGPGGVPQLPALLEALAEDAPALAEDLALRAWKAWDFGEHDAARALGEQALALDAEGDLVRVLDAVLHLDGEARLERLAEEGARIRASLDPHALEALDEGRGHEDLNALRLHRCESERIHLLSELGRHAECVALTDELFMESNVDTFGVFPVFVGSALLEDDLDTLDAWVEEMGEDYPGLQEWLQVYLHQTADRAGAAYKALRHARKQFPEMERALLAWGEALEAHAPTSEAPLPTPVLPKDPRTASVFLLLAPALAATPTFVAWLRKMRTMR